MQARPSLGTHSWRSTDTRVYEVRSYCSTQANCYVHTGLLLCVHTGQLLCVHTGQLLCVHTGQLLCVHTGLLLCVHTGLLLCACAHRPIATCTQAYVPTYVFLYFKCTRTHVHESKVLTCRLPFPALDVSTWKSMGLPICGGGLTWSLDTHVQSSVL